MSCHLRRQEVSPWRRPNKRANCPLSSDPALMARFGHEHVQLPVVLDYCHPHLRVRPLSAVSIRSPSEFWPTASRPLGPADLQTPVARGEHDVIHYVLKAPIVAAIPRATPLHTPYRHRSITRYALTLICHVKWHMSSSMTNKLYLK